MENQSLRELRAARMVTQRETARAVGMTEANYARVERGHHVPRPEMIRKIAEYFDVDPAELRDKLTSKVA